MLTPTQQQILRLFLDLPVAGGYALAGGAALVLRGVVSRTTHDPDFFAPPGGSVSPASGGFQAALEEHGFSSMVIRSSPSFVRLVVTAPSGEQVLVDLGQDFRLAEVEEHPGGRTLSLADLAADKLLAVFGRAEARDFVDVFCLARVVGLEAMLDWARAKERAWMNTPWRPRSESWPGIRGLSSQSTTRRSRPCGSSLGSCAPTSWLGRLATDLDRRGGRATARSWQLGVVGDGASAAPLTPPCVATYFSASTVPSWRSGESSSRIALSPSSSESVTRRARSAPTPGPSM